jgi:nicotinate-nucleotide pyrophosphorylase (carboxylating)
MTGLRMNIKRADVEQLIRMAIAEDIGEGDITSRAIFTDADTSRGTIVSRQDGVICGCDMVRYVYGVLDARVSVVQAVNDGAAIGPGSEILSVEGPTISVLSGERIALNFMQRMTGIATRTSRVVSLLAGTPIRLLDTRKTTPGYRLLDKYAVRTGGGTNHRMGLYDMVMVKDNHISAAGGIGRAVAMVREQYGSKYTVEVEAATLDEVGEAVRSGADIIMLDNMDREMMKAAVDIIQRKARIEISGNMDETRIMQIRELAVDYISMGSLTHSVAAFDLSMEFV